MTERIRAHFTIGRLAALLLIMAVASIFVGASGFEWKQLGSLFASGGPVESQFQYVLWHIRLPRVLLAGTVGAGLAVSGAAIQGLFRNPLADHTLIGVSNGAMLFAVVAIVIGGASMELLPAIVKNLTVGAFAFAGGLLTTLLVFTLSSRKGHTSVITMLMAGIAISAFAAAAAGLMIYFSDEQQLRDISFWSLGSFGAADWMKLAVAAPIILPACLMLHRHSKELNAILLGESEAMYLGVAVQSVKRRIIVITSLMIGVSIAVSGIIGFVGLIVPHFIRLIRGSDYRFLMKSSALVGALFMILADSLARTVIAPAELPIGILTAFVGAPFFLWLLMNSRQKALGHDQA